LRHRAWSVTFAAYAANWLAGFLDDAPNRARFEAALKRRLLPVFGGLLLLELLDTDREELHRQLVNPGVGGDDDATRECLELVLEDAIHELDAGTNGRHTSSSRVTPSSTASPTSTATSTQSLQTRRGGSASRGSVQNDRSALIIGTARSVGAGSAVIGRKYAR
jgi:hypothetical protein